MAASEFLVNVLFYVFALVAVAGAVGVAASRNIVRSAFALLAVLFAAAALYALMKADFIAGAQVLIYVGGILVLIIFAVMLTHRITDVKISNDSTPGPAAFCAVLCLLFALVVIILPVPDPRHNKWDAVRGPEFQAVEGQDYSLFQLQGDGKTGLARGGNAFDGEVVVGVKAGHWPEDAISVVAEAWSEKQKLAEASVPVDRDHATALVRLTKLEEKPYTWRVRVVGAGKDLTSWMSLKGDEPAFVVTRGVTEPIAWALSNPYLFAFEAISVLLLAALVGAAFLARKEVMG